MPGTIHYACIMGSLGADLDTGPFFFKTPSSGSLNGQFALHAENISDSTYFSASWEF